MSQRPFTRSDFALARERLADELLTIVEEEFLATFRNPVPASEFRTKLRKRFMEKLP